MVGVCSSYSQPPQNSSGIKPPFLHSQILWVRNLERAQRQRLVSPPPLSGLPAEETPKLEATRWCGGLASSLLMSAVGADSAKPSPVASAGACVRLPRVVPPPGLAWNLAQLGGRPRERVWQDSKAFLGSRFRSCRAPVMPCGWRGSYSSAQLGSRCGAWTSSLNGRSGKVALWEQCIGGEVWWWRVCKIWSATWANPSFAKSNLHFNQLVISPLCSSGLALSPRSGACHSVVQLSPTVLSADLKPRDPLAPAQSAGRQEWPWREKQKCFSVIFKVCCVSIVGKFKRLSYN